MTPDIVAEAIAFFNETAADERFDLWLPLVWGYVLGPLQYDQIEPLTTLLLEQGFTAVEPACQEGSHALFEVHFSELRVHTVDSYADRIKELAEFAQQQGLEIIDWSAEDLAEGEAEVEERRHARVEEQPTEPLAPLLLAFFMFPFQADIVRFRLELEGIRTWLADEALVGWCWQYSNAVGGVKVLVKEEDLPRALEILDNEEEAADPTSSEAISVESPDSDPSSPHVPQRWACPHCGARVPNDFCVCWACGTTMDGQTDPGFEVADAPTAQHGLDRPVTIWWPALILVCLVPLVVRILEDCPVIALVCLPVAAYELLVPLLPERAAERRKRRATFSPLDPRLVRACRVAVLAICLPSFALSFHSPILARSTYLDSTYFLLRRFVCPDSTYYYLLRRLFYFDFAYYDSVLIFIGRMVYPVSLIAIVLLVRVGWREGVRFRRANIFFTLALAISLCPLAEFNFLLLIVVLR